MQIKHRYTGAVLLEIELLRGANLCGANLCDADLSDAELSGADLRGATIIDAGQESRGYRYVAIQHAGGYMIAAGCRWFTTAEARDHWADNPEALRKCDAIEAEARARGWMEAEAEAV